MDRKRAYQNKMEMRSRFNRCKTPMGAVPISVIMGFDYPLEDRVSSAAVSMNHFACPSVRKFNRCKTPMGAVPISVIMGFDYPLEDRISGRGESAANYSTYSTENNSSSAYKTDYSSSYNYNSYDQSTNESNKRSIGSRGFLWPSSLRQAEETPSSRFERARTEALETLSSSRDRYLRSYDPSEHPKQQPCNYPAALSSYTNPSPTVSRYTRATTLAPSVVSPWRSAGSSGYTNSYRSTYWTSSPASRTYYSSVRSRFL